jgi:hypothetical protein
MRDLTYATSTRGKSRSTKRGSSRPHSKRMACHSPETRAKRSPPRGQSSATQGLASGSTLPWRTS